jgi:5'-deoxynucleotidase YfbR-like HD superfamily hydrolase
MSRPFVSQNSGNKIYLDDLTNNTYLITDIAHSLSCNNRWNGHADVPISVAQHSYYCSQMCGKNSKLALNMLLHDMAESVLSDIPRPIKAFIAGAKEFDDRIYADMALKFGVDTMTDAMSLIDNRMLKTEATQLLKRVDTSEWGDWYQKIEPYDFKITSWRPEFAKEMFLDRYNYLVSQKAMHEDGLVDDVENTHVV